MMIVKQNRFSLELNLPFHHEALRGPGTFARDDFMKKVRHSTYRLPAQKSTGRRVAYMLDIDSITIRDKRVAIHTHTYIMA